MTFQATRVCCFISLVVVGRASAAEIEFPTTAPAKTAITSATAASAQPTSVTLAPHFDIWADQPRLGFCLPAIRSWMVFKHVHAVTDLPKDAAQGVGQPQLIFIQRPTEKAGLSKYSVIFQAANRDPKDHNSWYGVAAAFYVAFLDQVRKSGVFAGVAASSPTVTTGELHRAFFTYRLAKKAGGEVGGAVVCLPVRGGVLFYNLTLEGQSGEAVETALQELMRQAATGLTMSTWSAKPYLIGALLALPLVVGAVVWFKRRRARPQARA